jgi:hypothetical protein
VKSAEDYVVSHPNDQEPTRPVVAAEHKHSANNRQKPDEADQNNLKVARPPQLAHVIGESDDADCYEYATDSRYCMRTFVHDYRSLTAVIGTDNSLPVPLVNSFASRGA